MTRRVTRQKYVGNSHQIKDRGGPLLHPPAPVSHLYVDVKTRKLEIKGASAAMVRYVEVTMN